MTGRRVRAALEPAVLRWARERARLGAETVAAKMGVRPDQVEAWERSGKISVSQADRLARHTHTPVGYLYLREPPEDDLAIADFRAAGGGGAWRPSPDLLDTVHAMTRRQAWMREELAEDGAEALSFVGRAAGRTPTEAAAAMWEQGRPTLTSARLSSRGGKPNRGSPASPTAETRLQRPTPRDVAERGIVLMWESLGLTADWSSRRRSWTDALRHLRDRAEASGILVVFNGVVGNNTHRRLDRKEFQGFALVDGHAPLVFVNSADFTAAQMFTLAHELAHVFTGATGVSNLEVDRTPDQEVETFCNRVAAEFLVPEEQLMEHWNRDDVVGEAIQAVARRFRVSVLVAARRALDLRLIVRSDFRNFYDGYGEQAIRRREEPAGGNFWNSQNVRIGRRFGAAVSRAVKEGRLSYREAYSLTGLRGDTFDVFMRSLDSMN